MGGGRVIFALTETQAAALGAIALGARVDAQSPALKALAKKGLVATANGALSLTDIGATAAALCSKLQLAKLLNGHGR